MRILNALTYYRPHTSGLTIYTERLAKALARRGHDVTVLTSQYDKSLPRDEIRDGVRIIRAPVWFRISKGVIMPTVGFLARRHARKSDVILLHLPQFDAAGIALIGWLFSKPTVLVYQCDLKLPSGLFNSISSRVVRFVNHLAAIFASRIVTNTQDYADHSPYASRYAHKVHIIPPPIELAAINEVEAKEFTTSHNPERHYPIIGMVTRFATEKGVEVLLEAFPKVMAAFPKGRIFFVGEYENVFGEEEYARRLFPLIHVYEKENKWKFLGLIPPKELSAFYKMIDVLVVSSLNSTESFGLVQIEAMMQGTPVVVSDLPGVRQPVLTTKMGLITPIGDSAALADALIELLRNRYMFASSRDALTTTYSPDAVAEEYEKLFIHLLSER